MSAPIVRMAAEGTSIALDVTIRPNFAPTGTFSAVASDPNGPIGQAVTITPQTDGSYVLSLATSDVAAADQYTGNFTIELCANAACTTRQPVASISVPRTITVLRENGAWPGDNLTALSRWTGVNDWTTFQGNAAHTGFVPVDLDPNAFRTRWRLAATATHIPFSNLAGSPIAIANDRVYLNADNRLYARAESDGAIAWEYDFSTLQFPSSNPPAVVDGIVYAAAGQQSSTFMFSFAAADGALRFQSPMHSQWENYLNPTVGPNGVYTNAGTYGGIFGFDTAGAELFYANIGQQSVWSPAVDANHVYAYTGSLHILHPTSGAIQTIPDPSFTNYVYRINGSPVLGVDSVFVANYANAFLNSGATGNTLLRFRPSTSSIAWSVPGNFPSTPAYANGVLYVANENPFQVEARAEEDGALLWRWIPPRTGDTKFTSEPLVTNNMLFVSTNSGGYGIELATRRVVWTWPGAVRFSLSANGVLYLHTGQQLVAINVK